MEHELKEYYAAYASGYTIRNPATYWFRGKLDMFKIKVILLIRRLQLTEMLGASSVDEMLQHAMESAYRWQTEGQDLVNVMLQKIGPPEAQATDGLIRRRRLDPMLSPRISDFDLDAISSSDDEDYSSDKDVGDEENEEDSSDDDGSSSFASEQGSEGEMKD